MSASNHPRRREDELLACCARVHLDATIRRRVETLLSQPLDYDYLVRSALWHGTAPLLHHHLHADLPADAAGRLGEFRSERAVRCFSLARELVDVMALLNSRNIHALAYKGPTLALSVFGDMSLRIFGDLDIIVPMADVPACSQLLLERGYYVHRSGGPLDLEQAQRFKHELTFRRNEPPGSKPGITAIEMHWTIAQRRYVKSFAAEQFWDSHRMVPVDGVEVPTLSGEDLLLVLCIHGAKNFWRQLKMLCDVAEILKKENTTLDWPRLWRTAGTMGCARVCKLGLYLAADILAAPLPDSVSREIRADSTTRLLAAQVKRWMFRSINPKLKLPERILFRLRSRERLPDTVYHLWSKLRSWDYAGKLR